MLDAHVVVGLGTFRLDSSIRLHEGTTVAVVGPNGAGKTTLLRALAGLVPLDAGAVTLDGTDLTGVPPEDRPVAVVFQDYRLFPHLTALENVAFGLRCRGTARSAARARARTWLDRFGVGEQADVRPGHLSGGQAQRVALARALAVEPRLLLLDEPLSAVDAGARVELRRELRRHLAAFPGMCLLVTHDALEAIALAGELIVVEGGRIVQSGPPANVTARPRSRYVADMVGVNLYRGTAAGDRVDVLAGGVLRAARVPPGEVFALVHPRAVSLHRRRPEGTPRNVWPGTAAGLDLDGDRVRVQVDAAPPIVAEVTPAAVADLALADGGPLWVSVKASEVDVYPA